MKGCCDGFSLSICGKLTSPISETPMKKLLVSMALAAVASVAFAQNAPKECPRKATCPQACKNCPKCDKAACQGRKDCPKKADCPKVKKG